MLIVVVLLSLGFQYSARVDVNHNEQSNVRQALCETATTQFEVYKHNILFYIKILKKIMC